jgi:molecular chaperone HtpG
MQVETGSISIHTENIFPIIKKFLYSDHEIFLRELVSNAVDASQKLKYLSSRGEFTGESGALKISVKIDSDKKTLHIVDRGIGMTGEEVKKYINQIAFSGATEFLNKYKEKPESGQLIGNFGLGFYSAFMVASEVEIVSLSWQEGAQAVRWKCDGSTEFTLEAADKTDRGTEIILHLNSDSEEFLQSHRIQSILEKYCRFMPVEIEFEEKIINNTKPLWTRKPADISNEEYEKFYEELFPYQSKPLFWIHLNVDFPFTLTGILYFPKYRPEIEPGKSRIQLYSRQVFITDAVKEVVPDFLMLLEGVLDSPDIPLNVSRSFLQADQNVKKINAHISKKVADKLTEIFRENREDFTAKWEDIQMFVKYGMLSDEKFLEKAKEFCLLQTTEGSYHTFEEYKTLVAEKQTDKDGKLILLYSNNPELQHTYLKGALDKGYSVLKMGTMIDAHFTGLLERTMENVSLVSIDSGSLDSLIDKGEERTALLSETESGDLKKELEEYLKTIGTYTVEVKALGEQEPPLLLTQPEFMRRMREMSALGQMSMMGNFPETWNAVLNTAHPLVAGLARETDAIKKKELTAQITDLALLSAGKLSGPRMAEFVKRSLGLMGK